MPESMSLLTGPMLSTIAIAHISKAPPVARHCLNNFQTSVPLAGSDTSLTLYCTQTRLCHAPFLVCNAPKRKQEQITLAMLSLQASQDMKNITARPLVVTYFFDSDKGTSSNPIFLWMTGGHKIQSNTPERTTSNTGHTTYDIRSARRFCMQSSDQSKSTAHLSQDEASCPCRAAIWTILWNHGEVRLEICTWL